MENEIWKDVPGFEYYQASNLGRIRSKDKLVLAPKSCCKNGLRKGVILRAGLNKNTGYLQYVLRCEGFSKSRLGHRVVLLTFEPNINNSPCVNHKNGIKTVNRVENLEWCTYLENRKHSIDNNLTNSAKGEKLKSSKLKNEQALFIFNSKEAYKELANRFGISFGLINDIKSGRSWAHITGHYDKKRKEERKNVPQFLRQ